MDFVGLEVWRQIQWHLDLVCMYEVAIGTSWLS